MYSSVGYKWTEISDLPGDLESFCDDELASLAQAWTAQKGSIEGDERVLAFNQELAREWAIETGIIEGAYTLERGITQTLIERGIDSSYIPHDATDRDPELVARIIQSHKAALEGIFAFVRGERELGTSYIKELHAALLQYVAKIVVFDPSGNPFEKKLEKGEYKKQPNNPRREDGTTHEYCPPEHVAAEMDRLIEMHREHQSRGVATHVEAAWLHHAFTQIHPFQDGNGRVARALASLVFIRAALFPLLVRRDDRASYIEALESADVGNLRALTNLFAQLQKRQLAHAIAVSAEVRPVHSAADAVNIIRDMVTDLGMITPKPYLQAQAMASELVGLTNTVMRGVAEKLAGEIGHGRFKFGIANFGGPPASQLQRLREETGSFLNPNTYFQSSLLKLGASSGEGLLAVIFTGEGPKFSGAILATAFFQKDGDVTTPLTKEPFRIEYNVQDAEIRPRYMNWLDQIIIKGLAEWRRTLV